MLTCLFEDPGVEDLYPFTRTRAVYELRAGHRTIQETIAEALGDTSIVVHCRRELADVVREETLRPVNRIPEGVDVLFVNGRLILHSADTLGPMTEAMRSDVGRVFVAGDDIVAAWIPASSTPSSLVSERFLSSRLFDGFDSEELPEAQLLRRAWDLLKHIDTSIRADFRVLSHGINIFERPAALISERADLINGEQIFTAPGAQIRSSAILDASQGPIIIDTDATVMEHAVLRGPVAIGKHSIVKVGAHLESCVVGPNCKVAGEVHDSVLHSYSNKSHAGFLGHSYLGSWVNLGAHTNTSNLKNDYGIVSAFNEARGELEKTGGIFAGLFMGDHSKCGIDSMFNTGTVVGVSCNLFGSGYHPRHVPSFLWGGPQEGFVPYRLEKALEVAEVVMKRRERELTPALRDMLTGVYSATEADRTRGPIR